MSAGKPHRRYTKDSKSQAVQLSVPPGMTVPKAAAHLGIPTNALYRWKQESAKNGEEAFRDHGNRTAAENSAGIWPEFGPVGRLWRDR